jgi:isocitrate lyase
MSELVERWRKTLVAAKLTDESKQEQYAQILDETHNFHSKHGHAELAVPIIARFLRHFETITYDPGLKIEKKIVDSFDYDSHCDLLHMHGVNPVTELIDIFEQCLRHDFPSNTLTFGPSAIKITEDFVKKGFITITTNIS